MILLTKQVNNRDCFQKIEVSTKKLISRNFFSSIFRTICEVAAAPESGNGIFGDFFNLLLTPQDELEAITNEVHPPSLNRSISIYNYTLLYKIFIKLYSTKYL